MTLALLALLARTALADGVADCGTPNAIEAAARAGRLPDDLRVCVENEIQAPDSQMDRERASLLLIADAWARGDRAVWAGLIERHLRSIDGQDPDVAFQYAQHLAQRGGDPEMALRWMEVAEQNAFRWPAADRPQKLLYVAALRTRTTKAMADQALSVISSDPVQRMRMNALQGRVRLYSVEWARLALEQQRDASEALALCTSTGWTEAECLEAARYPRPATGP
jgi:hypothetical protein